MTMLSAVKRVAPIRRASVKAVCKIVAITSDSFILPLLIEEQKHLSGNQAVNDTPGMIKNSLPDWLGHTIPIASILQSREGRAARFGQGRI
jgi:hypothetical protein